MELQTRDAFSKFVAMLLSCVERGSDPHEIRFFLGDFSGEPGSLLRAIEGPPGQFRIGGMIAGAMSAGGDCVCVGCVVVEFRGLGMFTLGHGRLLLRPTRERPVSGVLHTVVRRAVQLETGANLTAFWPYSTTGRVVQEDCAHSRRPEIFHRMNQKVSYSCTLNAL